MLICPISLEPLKIGRSCIEMPAVPTRLKELHQSVNNLWKSCCNSSVFTGFLPALAWATCSFSTAAEALASTHGDIAFPKNTFIVAFPMLLRFPMYVHVNTARAHRKIVESSILDRSVNKCH